MNAVIIQLLIHSKLCKYTNYNCDFLQKIQKYNCIRNLQL